MRKTLSFVLCILMLLSCSSTVFAANADVGSSTGVSSTDQDRVAEITELRRCNSETILLSDGSRECVVYAENKYYQDEGGEYKTIDNAIVSAEYENNGVTYKYANAANSIRAYFSENGPSILIRAKGYDLAFSLPDADASDVKAGDKCPEYHFPGYDLLGVNHIAYLGVCQDADLVYSVNNGVIKEYIILSSNDAPQEYSFRFDTSAYTIRQNEDGTVGVFDSDGELCFELGKLFAIDSAGVYTDSVNYEIIEEKGETTTVKVVVDPDYLEHPDRTYPVLIDPSIMVTGEWNTYDTYVASRYPATNYYLQHYFRTGRDEDFYTRRTFIKFDLPSGITSSSISSAYIDVKYYSGSTSGVKAFKTI